MEMLVAKPVHSWSDYYAQCNRLCEAKIGAMDCTDMKNRKTLEKYAEQIQHELDGFLSRVIEKGYS
jgi:hypothetical protein